MEDRCMESICSMMETLTNALSGELAKGTEQVNTHEAGEVTDMIKDLAETKRNLYEACYYKKVAEAMDEAEDYRMGYTPSTKQHRYMEQWLRDPEAFEREMRDKDYGEFPLRHRGEFEHEGRQYGKPYCEYLEARKHYTESHTAMDKAEMDRRASEHLVSAMTTIRTIYGDADPELRKKIKADFTKLVADMPA